MKRAVTVLSVLLITSCGTTELSHHDRDEIGTGRKAIVRTSNQTLFGSVLFGEREVVRILTVDGREHDREVLKLDEQLALEIGTHVLEVGCFDRRGHQHSGKDFTDIIVLDVKPQHEYLIRCSFDSRFGPDGTYVGSFDVQEKRVKS